MLRRANKQFSTTFYCDVEINLPNINATKAGTFKQENVKFSYAAL